MTHVLLIDDDATLSGMLTEYLRGEGFDTSAVFDGEDGLEAMSNAKFDAIILDVMLPSMSGIDVLRRIRQDSSIPVIMLTAKGDNVDRVIGLEVGADDYIAKPYYARELVARLRAVLRRQAVIHNADNTGLISGNLHLNAQRREVLYGNIPVILTASEFNLLESLMLAKDRVATKEDLSRAVLHRERQPYDRSVDVHIGRLRRKLRIASDGIAEIETVRGVGYRLRNPA